MQDKISIEVNGITYDYKVADIFRLGLTNRTFLEQAISRKKVVFSLLKEK